MNEKETSIYMAGFFDGEGCIGLSRRKRSEHWTEYTIRLSIGQKDGAIMDWLKTNFGGMLYLVKRDNSFMWVATNQVAFSILKRITPYLKYKKPQAEIALRFFEERKGPKRLSEEETQRREAIYLQLKEEKQVFTKSINLY